MIQLNDIKTLTADDMPKLVDLIQPELRKRKDLYTRHR